MPSTISCPTCGRPVLVADDDRAKSFPFCSARCRDRDLGAWFDGRYTVAGEPATLDEADGRPHSDRDHP